MFECYIPPVWIMRLIVTFKCSMFECSLILRCSKVRVFGCSLARIFACLNVRWFSNVRLFNVRMFFNSSPKSMFVCSNVRRTWTNIRTLNTNVRCSVAPAAQHKFFVKINLIKAEQSLQSFSNFKKNPFFEQKFPWKILRTGPTKLCRFSLILTILKSDKVR